MRKLGVNLEGLDLNDGIPLRRLFDENRVAHGGCSVIVVADPPECETIKVKGDPSKSYLGLMVYASDFIEAVGDTEKAENILDMKVIDIAFDDIRFDFGPKQVWGKAKIFVE